MHIINIIRILGMVLMLFSVTMIPPMVVAWWYDERVISMFLLAMIDTFLFGLIIWLPTRMTHREIRAREGFLIVTLLWTGLSVVSALPFVLSQIPNISIADALFESIAGLTTTGATVFTNLDNLPRALLYYRQQLQLIGGGGIILFSIAILPMLGVGGMQLYRAEMPGPFKEDKLTPRIAQTAKTLWYLYLGLVLCCALAYWAAGMSLFDAIGHSFGTVSTGGFSTHDKNLGYFDNPVILCVASVFMLLGAINFSLHYLAVRGKTLRHYWQDMECRSYLYLIGSVIVLVFVILLFYQVFQNPGITLLESVFQVISFSTTTGFFNHNYSQWPTFIPMLLMMLCLIGGSAGSTSGGIKMIRAILLYKQWFREVKRLIHPNGHYIIKLGYSRLHHRTLDAVWGFFGIFIVSFVIFLLLLIGTGLDLITAFSGLVAAISSTGLGLGGISDHFYFLNEPAKLILCVAMLAGRLEFFTLIVLMTPSYWRT